MNRQQEAIVARLQAENTQLRKALEILADRLNGFCCHPSVCEDCRFSTCSPCRIDWALSEAKK